MSFGKQAPIDKTAGNLLASASRQDYDWSNANFQDLYDDLNYGISQSQIDSAAGTRPDKKAIEEEIRAANPRPPNQGGRGFGFANAAWQADIKMKTEDEFKKRSAAWEQGRSEIGQQMIKDREQAKFTTELGDVQRRAEQNLVGAQRGSDRAQSRMGLRSASPGLQAEIDRQRAFTLAEAKAGNANTTRSGQRDRSIQRAQIAAGLGAAIKQMGQESLGTAADMASGRNSYNASQTRGGFAGGLVSGLGAGLMVAASGGAGLPALLAGGTGFAQGYN